MPVLPSDTLPAPAPVVLLPLFHSPFLTWFQPDDVLGESVDSPGIFPAPAPVVLLPLFHSPFLTWFQPDDVLGESFDSPGILPAPRPPFIVTFSLFSTLLHASPVSLVVSPLVLS